MLYLRLLLFQGNLCIVQQKFVQGHSLCVREVSLCGLRENKTFILQKPAIYHLIFLMVSTALANVLVKVIKWIQPAGFFNSGFVEIMKV